MPWHISVSNPGAIAISSYLLTYFYISIHQLIPYSKNIFSPPILLSSTLLWFTAVVLPFTQKFLLGFCNLHCKSVKVFWGLFDLCGWLWNAVLGCFIYKVVLNFLHVWFDVFGQSMFSESCIGCVYVWNCAYTWSELIMIQE